MDSLLKKSSSIRGRMKYGESGDDDIPKKVKGKNHI
jgi:hypothetical protein